MKTNRRDLLRAAAVIPVMFTASGAVLMADDELAKQHSTKLEHIADLPLKAGKVIGMVQFQDDIFIATEYGGVYRLFDLL